MTLLFTSVCTALCDDSLGGDDDGLCAVGSSAHKHMTRHLL